MTSSPVSHAVKSLFDGADVLAKEQARRLG
jgi:hypothetical protein